MRNIIRDIGRGLYSACVAIAVVAFLGSAVAIANYAVTQGSGTNFGSVVVSSVHYAQQLICDLTTPSQCAAVDSSGNLSVKSSTLATAANQSTEITSLSTIATNTGAATPAGTLSIGTLNPFAETAAASGVLKASAGNLFTISADAVTATTDLKLLLFNSTTLPADGTVTPYKCISFKGDGTQASLTLSWAPDALAFSTGMSAAVSSNTACTTKTNVTATISGQVQ